VGSIVRRAATEYGHGCGAAAAKIAPASKPTFFRK
jgi:hypothetical protein